MKPLKHKQSRIFFLFILGIVVPSLLLGYLAFRGVRNDQALVERDKREELQRQTDKITSEIENWISRTEQLFMDIASEETGMEKPSLLQKLNMFKDQNPIAAEPYLFDSRRGIQFPAAKLLYISGSFDELLPSAPLSSSLSRLYDAGKKEEFQNKDYRKALSYYQQGFKLASSSPIKGEMLNAVARVQKNSSLLQEALDSYKTLAENYGQVRISTGLTLGLVAGLEIGHLNLLLENPSSAGQSIFDLYKSLLEGTWKLERAQYDYFSRTIKDSLENVFSNLPDSSALDSLEKDFLVLRDEEKLKKKTTEEFLLFQDRAAPDLLNRISQEYGWTQNLTKRNTLEIDGQHYFAVIFKNSVDNINQSGKNWGLLFDRDSLAQKIREIILKNIASTKEAGWFVSDREGRTLMSSEVLPAGSIQAQANFRGNFPDWQLNLQQLNPRLFETFLTSRRGIYFFMFLLIGGILIFGLILTLRTVSRELELARMQSDFVSTISHEFKSPLTSIRQLAEMLQAGRIPSEERRQKYYDVLVEQSERLTLLTENVLSFARMEEGKKEFVYQSLDVEKLLEDIVSAFQERVTHEDMKLELQVDGPLPAIEADGPALSQAINNLIDNAVKYSGKAKKVIVRTFLEDSELAISVKDFGEGIKKEELEKVFERFYRAGDELTRTVKGSGLGLTLVKQIVEAHKGTVDVESERGQGSVFTIRLPLQ
jgi:signal transduction histidine kinase